MGSIILFVFFDYEGFGMWGSNGDHMGFCKS